MREGDGVEKKHVSHEGSEQHLGCARQSSMGDMCFLGHPAQRQESALPRRKWTRWLCRPGELNPSSPAGPSVVGQGPAFLSSAEGLRGQPRARLGWAPRGQQAGSGAGLGEEEGVGYGKH